LVTTTTTTTTTTTNFLEELMTFVQLLSMLWEHIVVQMVEALCYTPEGHGFDSQLRRGEFSLT
jgi:hypothetical protein